MHTTRFGNNPHQSLNSWKPNIIEKHFGARKPTALKQDSQNRQMLMFVCLMMRNATFNNISVLLVEETEDPQKTTHLSQVTDKLYHIILIEIRIHNVRGDRHWLPM